MLTGILFKQAALQPGVTGKPLSELPLSEGRGLPVMPGDYCRRSALTHKKIQLLSQPKIVYGNRAAAGCDWQASERASLV